jgi:hypothetical protein
LLKNLPCEVESFVADVPSPRSGRRRPCAAAAARPPVAQGALARFASGPGAFSRNMCPRQNAVITRSPRRVFCVPRRLRGDRGICFFAFNVAGVRLTTASARHLCFRPPHFVAPPSRRHPALAFARAPSFAPQRELLWVFLRAPSGATECSPTRNRDPQHAPALRVLRWRNRGPQHVRALRVLGWRNRGPQTRRPYFGWRVKPRQGRQKLAQRGSAGKA